MIDRALDVVFVLGFASIALGVFLVATWAGFVVAGALGIVLTVILDGEDGEA
jgi:hypothetical protein